MLATVSFMTSGRPVFLTALAQRIGDSDQLYGDGCDDALVRFSCGGCQPGDTHFMLETAP